MMTPEERHELVVEMAAAVACAIQPVAAAPQLTADEIRWVKLAIEAESRKIKFRDAVIEKSLMGLIFLAIGGVGYALKEFAMNHFWKP